jgi:hypothetical protein
MSRAICIGLLPLLSVVVTGCGQINVAAQQPKQSTSTPISLTDLHDVSDLQARFNQDVGKPRLLLLVSPT